MNLIKEVSTSMNLEMLETEQVNKNTMHIDEMETAQVLETIHNEDCTICDAVAKIIPNLTVFIDEIARKIREGGKVIYIGAGTSGRLGVLDASECPPTYGVDPSLIQGIIAGGFGALLKAVEGAEDSFILAQEDLQSLKLQSCDTVIGLAASGRTPYVIGGLEYAKSIGALTGAISCVSNSEIGKHAIYNIEVITGAESITGSTRMKAGTAQKMILNMISTSLMIKYGKVYQNLMVDVQPTNLKLLERAKRIIMHASKCTSEEATKFLHQSDYNVKVAVCIALTEKDKKICETILQSNGGNVSQAIHALDKFNF